MIKKELEQWFFKITKYADELLDYSTIDWPERVRTLADELDWSIRRCIGDIPVPSRVTRSRYFTTRPDTLWGATFMVLAPEHPLVKKITTPGLSWGVETYIQQAARQGRY